jgi:hypothetical protein
MKCEELEPLLGQWEKGSLQKECILLAAEHIGTCESCSRRFSQFLPLLLRDGEKPFQIPETGGAYAGPVPDIAGPVMERIFSRRLRVRTSSQRRLILVPVLAVLFVGLALPLVYRSFFHGSGNEVIVHFIVDLPEARTVNLVGDFSDWKPDLYRLSRKDSSGAWEIDLRLPKGKVYTYNFVVDGAEWIPDPKAPCKVGDGFGGESSLLQL